jgi:hypothetical protein
MSVEEFSEQYNILNRNYIQQCIKLSNEFCEPFKAKLRDKKVLDEEFVNVVNEWAKYFCQHVELHIYPSESWLIVDDHSYDNVNSNDTYSNTLKLFMCLFQDLNHIAVKYDHHCSYIITVKINK